MPVFSGLTIVNTTFATTLKSDLMTSVTTQLQAAGWTLISGGGTANVLFQSKTTPQGLAIRCRMKDNGGSCVDFSIETVDGVVVGNNTTAGPNAGYIFPGITYRIVASGYQFILYAPSNYTQGGRCVLISCPYVVAPNAVPAYCGIGFADTTGDGGPPGQASSPRTHSTLQVNGATPSVQAIWGGSLFQQNSSNNGGKSPDVVIPQCAGGNENAAQPGATQYADGLTIPECDPVIAWPLTTATTQHQIRAELWDSSLVLDSYPGETPATWGGHSWICVTNSNGGANSLKGSWFFATS